MTMASVCMEWGTLGGEMVEREGGLCSREKKQKNKTENTKGMII